MLGLRMVVHPSKDTVCLSPPSPRCDRATRVEEEHPAPFPSHRNVAMADHDALHNSLRKRARSWNSAISSAVLVSCTIPLLHLPTVTMRVLGREEQSRENPHLPSQGEPASSRRADRERASRHDPPRGLPGLRGRLLRGFFRAIFRLLRTRAYQK